jgi:hypothetical protein
VDGKETHDSFTVFWHLFSHARYRWQILLFQKVAGVAWACMCMNPDKKRIELHYTPEKEKPTEFFLLVTSEEVNPASVFKYSQLKI